MARVINKQSSVMFDDEINVEELGLETEAEKQMKVILEKQLNKNLSLKEQFAQHRTFVSPSTYKSLSELVTGTCSFGKFKELEQNEELHQELQRCGLAEEEITDYLAFKSGKITEKRLMNPEIWAEKLRRIEEKVKAHQEDLSKPQGFKNVKKLTRHEMELERTLYAGCSDKNKLSALVSLDDSCSDSYTDSAFFHVKTIANNLSQKKRRKVEEFNTDITSVQNVIDFRYDPNLHHVVVPLDDDYISANCLSVEQIRELPKFGNYKMGEPNKNLYVKNLHPKTTSQELRSIFGRFEDENTSPIEYRICTGRMKGQAFLKFNGIEIAEKALNFANGFILRGKPIIIEFGRKT